MTAPKDDYAVTSNSEIMCWIAFIASFFGGLVSLLALGAGEPAGGIAFAGFLAVGVLCVISSQIYEFHKRYEKHARESRLPSPLPVVAVKASASSKSTETAAAER